MNPPFDQWLLRASWQAALLAAIIPLVQWGMGNRLSARWRHNLWLLVVLRLMLPSLPQSPWSIYHLLPGDSQRAVQIQPEHSARPPQTGVPVSQAELIEMGLGSMAASPAPKTVPPPGGPKSSMQWKVLPWKELLLSAWVVCAALLLIRTGVGTWRLRRSIRRMSEVRGDVFPLLEECRRRMGVRRPVKLLAGDVPVPALVGFLRPRILLPARVMDSLPRRELRLVLMHELAHIRRGDVAVNWVVCLLQILHWFNPVLWVAFARLRAERELACDELVLGAAEGDQRQAYGQTILRLLEDLTRQRRSALPGTVGILEFTHLTRRITMIAQFKQGSQRWSLVAGLAMVLLAAVALTDAGQPRAGESRNQPAPEAAPLDPVAPVAPAAERPGALSPGGMPAAPGRMGGGGGTMMQPGVSMPARGGYGGMGPMAGMMRPDPDAEANAQTQQMLRKRMPTVEFENAALKDAISMIREYTGANFYVDERALEEAGVPMDAPVRLRLKDVPASEVLKLVLRSAAPNALYRIEGGVVMVTAANAQAETLAIRAYDVSDLTGMSLLVKSAQFLGELTRLSEDMNHRRIQSEGKVVNEKELTEEYEQGLKKLREKYGPVAAEVAEGQMRATYGSGYGGGGIARGGGGYGGGGYGGGGMMGVAGNEQLVEQKVQQLMQIIRETVAPDTWSENGGMAKMKNFGSKIIVSQSEANHQMIEKVLEMLREKPSTKSDGATKPRSDDGLKKF